MARHLPPGLHPIRGLVGMCHLLVDDAAREAVLIDAGLVGERAQIMRALAAHGLPPGALKAVLLTHGHIDHVGNLAWVLRWSGASLYAHPAEQRHIDGDYPYEGAARWCGRMERIGYDLIGYRPVKIGRALERDDEELSLWGGLRVVHLPGHTIGHCGFYSARYDLLFSGDLFASFLWGTHRPPAIFNSAPHLLADSLRRVRAMDPGGILPQHYDFADPQLHRSRFAALCRDVGISAS